MNKVFLLVTICIFATIVGHQTAVLTKWYFFHESYVTALQNSWIQALASFVSTLLALMIINRQLEN